MAVNLSFKLIQEVHTCDSQLVTCRDGQGQSASSIKYSLHTVEAIHSRLDIHYKKEVDVDLPQTQNLATNMLLSYMAMYVQ